MTTVKQLIEKLQTLDPDLHVRVLAERTHGYSTTTKWVELDLGEYSDNFWVGDKIVDLGDS